MTDRNRVENLELSEDILNSLPSLIKTSRDIRLEIFNMAMKAGKGHLPPALSWVEIGVALFLSGMTKIRPEWQSGDTFLLSKGHGCLTYYALLSRIGAFENAELYKFLEPGHYLAGHPDPVVPGVPNVSGSLGHGLGVGAGIALARKIRAQEEKVFVLLGDGEMQEGSVWEALMFAGNQDLQNLIAIVDFNKFQATDEVEKMGISSNLLQSIVSFGWEIRRINGHDFLEILSSLDYIRKGKNRAPLLIIAETIKGKGISFMEASKEWHHTLPKGKEIDSALNELRQESTEKSDS
jgi:transketolase